MYVLKSKTYACEAIKGLAAHCSGLGCDLEYEIESWLSDSTLSIKQATDELIWDRGSIIV